MRYNWSSLNKELKWLDSLAELSESFPKGFSTMIRDQPAADMQVSLTMVVTEAKTEGGRAK